MPLPERLPVTTGQPTHLPPAYAPVQVYDQRRVVYLPDQLNPGQSVAVDLRDLQPTNVYQPPRDLTPQPILDVTAQRILATGIGGGVAAAGTGWGVGQAVGGLAGISTGTVFWLALLVLAAKLPRAGGRARHETHNHVTNNNRWFGSSKTNLH